MTKRFSAVAIDALKEALTNVFWYKDRLKSFLLSCVENRRVVLDANWDAYKRQIVTEIVDVMCADQDRHVGDLRRLIHEVCSMDNFPDLEKLEDSRLKTDAARKAVQSLRRIVETHETVVREAADVRKRKLEHATKATVGAAIRNKLEEINDRYVRLVCGGSPHRRGFELERVMYELFKLHDLDPRASFRNTGEQIDGAFSLDGVDFLFEAKWQKEQSAIGDLDSFGSKIRRKLDNTLGLFLSIAGFSQDGINAHSHERPVMLLMTGEDFMAVLEQRLDFVSLLDRKRKHAAQTGSILIEIRDILKED